MCMCTYLSFIRFQRARNSAYHHCWVKTLQNTNFSGVKKSCLVLSMTTKHIFQFIQWDFKEFHKTKCGGGFSSRRGACNSSIEVKTWKSPKLESHFHRHSSCLHLQIEYFCWREWFLSMLVDAYTLSIHGPNAYCTTCDVQFKNAVQESSHIHRAQHSPGWQRVKLVWAGGADCWHQKKHSLLHFREML